MKKIFFLSTAILFSLSLQAQENATIAFNKNTLTISYGGHLIYSGKLSSTSLHYRFQKNQQLINNALHQTISINADNRSLIELSGEINGSDESIACESSAPDKGLRVVRHVAGQSNNLLNNAVYNRKEDWLLSFDVAIANARIKPKENHQYDAEINGREIIIRFLPHYYQKHRALGYFNPSQYSVWKKSVAGWCSWFAYFDKITETDIKNTADVISEKLQPYGLEYLQIDDGYQQVPIGLPDTWLKTNEKFPSGLKSIADYIKSKKLKPAIWTNVTFADSANAFKNKNLFVQNNNVPAFGNWVGYVMDGSNPQTIKTLISPVYKGLKDDGWQYFKLDALRHLKYEGYNSYADYFKTKKYNRNEAYRNIVKAVRKEIGADHFLLACWGIRPELVGIVDGCRIGNDGYSYAGLAQFNSYNNIIWRNDPDHIELSEKEAFRSCTATSLTGSLFMLTDKPEKYNDPFLIEAAKRSIPVLFTQPGQVYDVDPSRSSLINLADVEMSGSGARPFDASVSTTTGLFSLEINKPFEDWIVLGRLDERDKIIPFKDLGLDENKEYLIFEFWTKKFIGSFKKQFEPEAIDTNYKCQVFCFREKQDHPQLLATNRHISCGGYELKEVQWKNNILSGSSDVVAGDEYIIYLYEPENFIMNSINTDKQIKFKTSKEGNLRTIIFETGKTNGPINWEIKYQ
ncbi:melibiase [mine drainage metagenome]|uniref:Melibiase n=1 Tax=mine drainage metagenome TaxID=410659 RepID=A0A1J5SUD6_9ZZZZ